MKVEIVSATRLTEDEFWDTSALGQSLAALHYDERIITRISYENRRGLPLIYNESILSVDDHDIVLFIHDDVWLHDFYFIDELIASLEIYDIVGLAGNRCRVPHQLAWYTKSNSGESNFDFLNGIVGQGMQPLAAPPLVMGPNPVECEFLDGLFVAAKKQVLRKNLVLFDPRFDFHFYDMDFCRSARSKKLRIGTCRISVTHQSPTGAYGSPSWQTNSQAYFKKWGS